MPILKSKIFNSFLIKLLTRIILERPRDPVAIYVGYEKCCNRQAMTVEMLTTPNDRKCSQSMSKARYPTRGSMGKDT